MTNKMLLAAAALTLMAFTGAANAQPFDHHGPAPAMRHDMGRHEVMRREVMRHDTIRHEFRRPFVVRQRVFETLRLNRFTGLGDPYFFRGHYVVRSHDRFGRPVLVEIDPYTGAFLGVIRI